MQVNILEYLERGGLRHSPEKIAVVDQDRSYTFAELEQNAKRCAVLLLRRLDAVKQPIAVYLPKCAQVIFADLGILYTGNIYANLDVKSPPQRTKAILSNVDPVVIITSRSLAPQLTSIGVNEDQLFFVEDACDHHIEYSSEHLWRRLDRVIDTDPLCIIHTSGSTGVPKGVVLSHRGTIDFMDWCFDCLGLDGSERIGSLSPFHFDIYTLELNLCLAKGSTLVIIPERLSLFPSTLMDFVSNRAITFIFWVPSIMVNIANQGLLQHCPLMLRTIFFAGEVFPMKQLNCWRRALPDATFVNLYGPIEITVDCTYFVLDREFKDEDSLPIGFPCRNTDVLILNEQNEQCKELERGELCVRGTSLALGYWNDHDKTSKVFVQNPLNKHYPELIYRTGDLVYRNHRGEIMFVGRNDYQIKHMGYRIELTEIEHHVRLVEGITNACVLYNKERKEITLFYETVNAAAVTPGFIRRKLSETLPKYMLPAVFHPSKELPRNANGKIDRAKLSEFLIQ